MKITAFHAIPNISFLRIEIPLNKRLSWDSLAFEEH